jgi:hypothetical protein
MPELILSDLTVMGLGYCVVGLEEVSPNSYRSVRPMPTRGFAWPEPFAYRRGEVVGVLWIRIAPSPPHVEDRQSLGLSPTGRLIGEAALTHCLERAEVSPDLAGLFGCELETATPRGNAWVTSGSGTRSICGCHYENIRFRIYLDPGGTRLRARLALPSGEVLNSLPVVDRDWRKFLSNVTERASQPGVSTQIESFFNRSIRRELLKAPLRFARIGVARPREGEDKCWLMLDSLFPQPQECWLDLL